MSVQPDPRGEQKLVAARDAFAAGRDLTVAIAAPDPGEPATPGLLPRDVPGFTGREDELSRLADLAGGGRVVVTAIGGTAGVGKTALAVHAAHRLLAEFPDGHLYADLRGYAEGQDPVEPGEVLEVFLRSLGVTAQDIPVDVAERSGLLRQLLASRRVVMVLDNARTEAQVRPLLPGAGTSLVLVTSRSTLPGLEADERISLDVLSQDEAVRMLAGLGGHRAAADPTAVAEVAELCGRLPLALRIAGQLLGAHPTWPVVKIAQLLVGERHRLTRLGAGDLQVRAAFEVSYQHLAPGEARLFRLLALHPGPDFTPTAAAALTEIDDETAELTLGRLAEAHLVTEDAVGRFTLHDLLRLFARDTGEQADTSSERTAAENRLVRHYENLAAFLDCCVNPALRVAAEEEGHPLSSTRQALEVFQAERPSLLAVLNLAVERGWDFQALDLSGSMFTSLLTLRYLNDLAAVGETALAAAQRLGDGEAEGWALSDLGEAYRELRRFEKSIATSQRALTILRERGDRRGEAQVLANLGKAYRQVRRFEEAIASDQQALPLWREVSDRRGEGVTLSDLGSSYQEMRLFPDAVRTYEQALAALREVGDRQSEAATLSNLGSAYKELGRLQEAIVSYQQAQASRREFGDRHGEGQTLTSLGNAYQQLRRSTEAIASHQQAVAIFLAIGDRYAEGTALSNLGIAYDDARRFGDAIDSYQRALAIRRKAGDRYEEGRTLNNLAITYARLRRFGDAVVSYQQARTIFREFGDVNSEGETLSNLGNAYEAMRQPDQAAAYWREAATAMRAAGDAAAAAGLEQQAADAQADRPRRWWRRAKRSAQPPVDLAPRPRASAREREPRSRSGSKTLIFGTEQAEAKGRVSCER